MRCIIAGSRRIKDTATVFNALRQCKFAHGITEVVCGGAMGVDTLGKEWARLHEIPVKFFYADWNTHGKAAGPIRNEEMASYADALILVWDGKSRGSGDMLQRAKAHELIIYEHIVRGQP